jgi:hypothetical protein
VLILDLYFLQVGLQIGFEGLNLEVVAGVALSVVHLTKIIMSLYDLEWR